MISVIVVNNLDSVCLFSFFEVKDELRYLKNVDLETFASNWRKVENGLISYAAKKLTCDGSSVILDRLREAQAVKGKQSKRLIKEKDLSILKANFTFFSDTHGVSYAAFELLLYLLPNNQPDFKKKGINTTKCFEALVQTFEVQNDRICLKKSRSFIFSFYISTLGWLGCPKRR